MLSATTTITRTTALVALLAACGPEAAEVSVAATPPVATFEQAFLGAAHVAPRYGVGEADALLTGASRLQAMGAKAIKLYLTPNYAEVYPGQWPRGLHSLVGLAQSPSFSSVFELPFEVFVLTTYAFANGIDGAFLDGVSDREADAEATEFEALTRYLLTRYPTKTFILQNWEGDWALLGTTDPMARVTEAAVDGMSEWLSVRQAAISRARNSLPRAASLPPNAGVFHGVEVNLVLDSARNKRVVNTVLRQVDVDMVSYSAWEALDPIYRGLDVAAAQDTLKQALAIIRANVAPSTRIYLGEIGFSENELDASGLGRAASLIDWVHRSARELDVIGNMYWQLFDNECDDSGKCRGFSLIMPNGEAGVAGRVFTRLLQE